MMSAIVVLMMSCEKTVDLDTAQVESKVVIEGLVTDYPGYQYVKITRSTDFYHEGHTPRVTNAIVTVEDDLGTEVAFTHNPNDVEDSVGYYKPSSGFIGVVGRTYKLTVEVDGKSYSAEDKLFPVTTLDSLAFKKNDRQYDDPKIPGRFYEVLMYAKEPPDRKDYYLFNFYRNDTLVLFNPTDIYFTDDVALGEEIDGVASPVYFALGDSARVEALSLSREGFVFYNDLYNLLNNDGGMYSPPPANSRTNLTNGALGFFQTSAVSTKGIKIE